MSYALFIYLATVFGGLKTFFGIGTFIAALITFFGLVSDAFDETKAFFKCVFFTAALALIGIFIPSERTVYLMVGASMVENVVQNERVQGLSDRLITVVEQRIDSYINEDEEAESE